MDKGKNYVTCKRKERGGKLNKGSEEKSKGRTVGE